MYEKLNFKIPYGFFRVHIEGEYIDGYSQPVRVYTKTEKAISSSELKV